MHRPEVPLPLCFCNTKCTPAFLQARNKTITPRTHARNSSFMVAMLLSVMTLLTMPIFVPSSKTSYLAKRQWTVATKLAVRERRARAYARVSTFLSVTPSSIFYLSFPEVPYDSSCFA